MGDQEPIQPQKIEQKGFIEELLGDVFNLDRGLPGTIWGMLKTPGEVIDAHFTERGKYVSPLRYCIIILAITTFISVRFVDYEAMMTNAMDMGADRNLDQLLEQLSTMMPSFDWVGYFQAINEIAVTVLQKFIQVIYLVLMAPLMALFSKLFFKKKKEKFINHYVMIVYALTTFAIFTIFLLPIMAKMETTDNFWLLFTGLPLMIGFIGWTMIDYLKLKGFSEYLQAVLALVFGYISYSIVSGVLLYVGAYIKISI